MSREANAFAQLDGWELEDHLVRSEFGGLASGLATLATLDVVRGLGTNAAAAQVVLSVSILQEVVGTEHASKFSLSRSVLVLKLVGLVVIWRSRHDNASNRGKHKDHDSLLQHVDFWVVGWLVGENC